MWNSRIGRLPLYLLLVILIPGVALCEETPPRPLEGNAAIPFPPKALEKDVEGTVEYRADIDEAGKVLAVTVLSVPETALGFEEQVVATVRTWRFSPAVRDGQAVAGTYEGTAEFYFLIPLHAGRMYTLGSVQLRDQVIALLKEHNFKFEERDEKNGVIVTRWRSVNAKGLDDLQRENIGDGITHRRFRLHVFVSPFAEPGRLYVNSMVEGARGGRKFTFYNETAPQNWLYDKLAERTGKVGHGIPVAVEPRRNLARTLLGPENVGECLRSPEYSSIMKGSAGLSNPQRIESSYIVPLYPAGSRRKGHLGKVLVQAMIHEDGWIGEINVYGTDTDDTAFHTSAAYTVSYWRYRPAMKGNCGVVVHLMVSVDYTLH